MKNLSNYLSSIMWLVSASVGEAAACLCEMPELEYVLSWQPEVVAAYKYVSARYLFSFGVATARRTC